MSRQFDEVIKWCDKEGGFWFQMKFSDHGIESSGCIPEERLCSRLGNGWKIWLNLPNKVIQLLPIEKHDFKTFGEIYRYFCFKTIHYYPNLSVEEVAFVKFNYLKSPWSL